MDYMSWFQKGPLLLKPNKQAVSPEFMKVDFFTALRFLKDTQKNRISENLMRCCRQVKAERVQQ